MSKRISFFAAALALVLAAGVPAAIAAPGGCTDIFGNAAPCMPTPGAMQQAMTDMQQAMSKQFQMPGMPGFNAPQAPQAAGAPAAPAGAFPSAAFPGMPDFGALLAGPCGGKCGAGEFCDASGACRADTCDNQHKYGCPDDSEALKRVACPAGGYTDCWATAAFKCYKGASANSVSCASKGGAATSSSTTSTPATTTPAATTTTSSSTPTTVTATSDGSSSTSSGARPEALTLTPPLPAGMSVRAASAAAPRAAAPFLASGVAALLLGAAVLL